MDKTKIKKLLTEDFSLNSPIEVIDGVEDGNIENPVTVNLKPGDIITVIDNEGSKKGVVQVAENSGDLNVAIEDEEESLDQDDLDIIDIIDSEDEEESLDQDDLNIIDSEDEDEEQEESLESEDLQNKIEEIKTSIDNLQEEIENIELQISDNEEIENIEDSEIELDLEDEEESLDQDDLDIIDIIDSDDEEDNLNAAIDEVESETEEINESDISDDDDLIDISDINNNDEIELTEDINISYDDDKETIEDIETLDQNSLDTNDLEIEDLEPEDEEVGLSPEELDAAGLGDLNPTLSDTSEEITDTNMLNTELEDEVSDETLSDVDEGEAIKKQEDVDELVVSLLDDEELEYISDSPNDEIDLKLESVSKKEKMLQESVKKLELENYKLLKVNGILNLLPDLSLETKQTLAESFDKCSTTTQVKNLYSKVVSTVKEHKKPKLNTLIIESNKGYNTIGIPMKDNFDDNILTEDQKRKNYLMGINENEEDYFG